MERQLTIERHYQRVVRKNCAGDVTSDEVETVKSPRYDFDLKVPLAPAAFTFRLTEGMNNIFVKYFYDCDATRKAGDYGSDTLSGRPCDENSRTLIVQYPVFVKLVQIELPGVQEIQEPFGGCKR